MACPLEIINCLIVVIFVVQSACVFGLLSHFAHAGEIGFVVYTHVCQLLPLQEKPTICFHSEHSVRLQLKCDGTR